MISALRIDSVEVRIVPSQRCVEDIVSVSPLDAGYGCVFWDWRRRFARMRKRMTRRTTTTRREPRAPARMWIVLLELADCNPDSGVFGGGVVVGDGLGGSCDVSYMETSSVAAFEFGKTKNFCRMYGAVRSPSDSGSPTVIVSWCSSNERRSAKNKG